MPDSTAALIASRETTHGPFSLGMENLGLIMTGLIQSHYSIRLDHPIPGYLAALLMGAMKANRAAYGYAEDHWADMDAYMRQAREAQSRNGK